MKVDQQKSNGLLFGDVAQDAASNGYRVHPMKLFTKGIFEEGWQHVHADSKKIKHWIADGWANSGMAILTGEVVGLDLDIRDKALTLEFADKAAEILGVDLVSFPQRRGKFPKLMLICRAETGIIRSRKSGKWRCWEGNEHQIEIKGEGGLVAAYNIHPETHKPYSWVNGSPHETPVSQLPTVNDDQLDELLKLFDDVCGEREGMERVTRGRATAARLDDDDWLNYIKAPDPDVTDAMVDEALALLANDGWADDRDNWMTVGFALYHQYEGSDEGFEKWDEWSQLSEKYVDGECERRWYDTDDLKPRDKTNAVTIGTVMFEASQLKGSAIVDAELEAEKQEQLAEVLREIVNTDNEQDVFELGSRIAKFYVESGAAAQAKIRSVLVDRLKFFKVMQPASLVNHMLRVTRSDHIADLTERYVHSREQLETMFPFLKDLFFSLELGAVVHRRKGVLKNYDSIEVAVGRDFQRILDEQKVVPENHGYFNATVDKEEAKRFRDVKEFILHVYKIPEIIGEVYYPDGDKFVTLDDGMNYMNTFEDWRKLPQTPEEEWDEAQAELVRKVKQLIYWHAGGRGEIDEGHQDYQVLMSWLAHKFQNPAQKMQWGVFLTGPQGTGKSTMIDILRAVMGESLASERNVLVISRDVITKSFTGWAAKGAVAVVDEIEASRLNPIKRDEFLIRLRPHLASSRVDREAKGKDSVSVQNFQDYMFFANSIDGMVISATDRRFTAFKSGFQSKEEAAQALVETDYINDLLAGLRNRETVSALRSMFLNFTISKIFNPARFYLSDATKEVIEASLGSVEQALDAIRITHGTYYFTSEYVIIKSLRGRMLEITNNAMKGRYDANIELVDDLKGKNNTNIIRKVLQEPPFNLGRDEENKFTYYCGSERVTVYTNRPWSNKVRQRFVENHKLVSQAERQVHRDTDNAYPLALEVDLKNDTLEKVEQAIAEYRNSVVKEVVFDEWE